MLGHSRYEGDVKMIRTTYLLGGMLTAMAVWLVYRGQQPREVEVLAHRLEEAWADHHTRV
jgi:heme/copper-type cytochrome/quinol oxidase subunit 4